ARRLHLPFGGHAPGTHPLIRLVSGGFDGVTPLEASNSGARVIDHELGGPECWREAWPDPATLARLNVVGQPVAINFKTCRENMKQFQRNDTWFVPTLMAGGILRNATSKSITTRFNDFIRKFWAGAPLQGNWLGVVAGSAPAGAPTPALTDSL